MTIASSIFGQVERTFVCTCTRDMLGVFPWMARVSPHTRQLMPNDEVLKVAVHVVLALAMAASSMLEQAQGSGREQLKWATNQSIDHLQSDEVGSGDSH